MLAGTMLDTNYFRNKVSEGTFDAMIVLKRFGADSLMADDFLKEDYERYTMKTKFLNNMETPFTGIIVTKDPDENELVDQSVLAMVSQECMTIAGIDAAFSIGRISQTEVGISARSSDQFNVQFIMEKMGGGGHHSRIMTRITLAGAFFLAFIAILPNFIGWITGIEGVYFGGTAILIVVGVAIDTMKQAESLVLNRQYQGFMK